MFNIENGCTATSLTAKFPRDYLIPLKILTNDRDSTESKE